MGAVVAAYNLPTVTQPLRLDPATLAAYSQVCDLMLNLDETLTRH